MNRNRRVLFTAFQKRRKRNLNLAKWFLEEWSPQRAEILEECFKVSDAKEFRRTFEAEWEIDD